MCVVILYILFVIVYCFLFLETNYCLSIERDNHEMHKQGICIECIENCYMMGCYYSENLRSQTVCLIRNHCTDTYQLFFPASKSGGIHRQQTFVADHRAHILH